MARIYLILFLISSVLLFVVIAAMQSGNQDKIALSSTDSYMEGVTVAHSVNNSVKWHATVRKVHLTENQKKAEMQGIAVKLTDGSVTIKAPGGVYDVGGNRVNLDGEVVALNKDYEIKSRNVTWDFNKQTLTSDAGVTLKGSRVTLNAASFRADKGELIELYGGVRVVIN
ncbi:MAG: LPS export ABC transporter periplasmic protein LptC [Magnetococcales bacterium]|nr:LPS export ABC transporter periplasmic protein LptC [Nitrospirota bacterium]